VLRFSIGDEAIANLSARAARPARLGETPE